MFKLFVTWLDNQTSKGKSWSPGLVVMGRDFVAKIVDSNPGTIYRMDIFLHIFVIKIVMKFV